MMGVVDRAAKYFGGHPKRQQALEKAISDTQPQYTKNKLQDLCRTRWAQRLDVLDTFQALMSPVFACLDIICTAGPSHWSTYSLTDARGLLLSITATDFICALVITNKYLGHLRALTCGLQAEAKGVLEAASEIDVVVHCKMFETTLTNTTTSDIMKSRKCSILWVLHHLCQGDKKTATTCLLMIHQHTTVAVSPCLWSIISSQNCIQGSALTIKRPCWD